MARNVPVRLPAGNLRPTNGVAAETDGRRFDITM
jgi:hypothetical protein